MKDGIRSYGLSQFPLILNYEREKRVAAASFRDRIYLLLG